MSEVRVFSGCVLAILASSSLIALLSQHAARLGLVDEPDHRKHHYGSIPLIGGIAFTLAAAIAAAFIGLHHQFTTYLIPTSLAILVVGVLDDRYDLRVSIRFLIQTLAVLAMVYATGVRIDTLGTYWGHSLTLGWMSVPFTVFAVLGLINAMNMMDGIDGLAAGLTLVGVGAIAALVQPFSLSPPLTLVLLLGAAMLPFLAANLGVLGRKIFMGDAGSMVVGYLLAWTLIWLSNSPHAENALTPASVLWCVALPVMDTVAVMINRMRQGLSPFKPDRGHVHHLLMARGLSPRRTLVALVALASSLALAGLALRSLPQGYSLIGFLGMFGVYMLAGKRLARPRTKPAVASLPKPELRLVTDHPAAHDLSVQQDVTAEQQPREITAKRA